MVFGLPVIGLWLYGRALGGSEAAGWSGILQALLAGWVTFVAAIGMLSEGIVLLLGRKRLTLDLLIALTAIGFYLWSIIALINLLPNRASTLPMLFNIVIILLASWSAIRWITLRASAR
jgi:cation transport ATPase